MLTPSWRQNRPCSSRYGYTFSSTIVPFSMSEERGHRRVSSLISAIVLHFLKTLVFRIFPFSSADKLWCLISRGHSAVGTPWSFSSAQCIHRATGQSVHLQRRSRSSKRGRPLWPVSCSSNMSLQLPVRGPLLHGTFPRSPFDPFPSVYKLLVRTHRLVCLTTASNFDWLRNTVRRPAPLASASYDAHFQMAP
jgi:hypothetical protein